MRHSCNLARAAAGLLIGLLATVPPGLAANEAMETGFVFELFGLEQCEALPPELTVEQIEAAFGDTAAIEEARAAGIPMLTGEMSGFMAGARIGSTYFGTRAGDSGLGAVSSVWGPLPTGNYATFCLALVQLGEQPLATGRYELVGHQDLEAASTGDLLAAVSIVVMEDTGRQSESGRSVYRIVPVGEGVVTGGSFELRAVNPDTMSAGLRIEGAVQLEDDDRTHPFVLSAETLGERTLSHVPTLSGGD